MNDEDLTYLISEILRLKKDLDQRFHYDEEYNPENNEDQMIWIANNLYHHISLYLERKGYFEYLKEFKSFFKNTMTIKEKILEIVRDDEGEAYLQLTIDINMFLRPLQEFGVKIPVTKNEDYFKLQNILSETKAILNHAKISNPKNEAEIYNAVKWILEFIFPTTRKTNSAKFIGKFGTYKPDILIPEVQTAIEYKYIQNNGSNIGTYIDQLHADSGRYKGDKDYNNFIAVVCLQNNTTLLESIKQDWKERKFPKNWELIPLHI